MKDSVSFAIIGTGVIAGLHAEAIAASPHAVLKGVFDLNAARARDFAAERDGLAVYTSLEALLGDAGVDAVTIATPTGTHRDVALPAACAGKHILCEKPLDVDLAKADEIIRACDDGGVLLSAVFQARFSENVQRIRQALEAGRFGRLVLASAQVKWFRSQAYYDGAGWRGTWSMDGGGALMNQSIHLIDLLLYLAGPPAEASARTATLTHAVEVEDTACAAVRFRNGALGVIECSTSCAPGFPRRLEISGEKGSVTLEGDALTRWQFADELPEDDFVRTAGATGVLVSGAADPRVASSEGHRRQIEDFARAIMENREPMIPGREGRKAIELICGIYQSAKTGQPVRFA